MKRQTQSKALIKESLTLLLKEKDFDKISVSQLSKRAGINRGTFYLHYLDKYDLMDQLKTETLTAIHAIVNDDSLEAEQIIRHILTYLKADLAFITIISEKHFIDFSKTMTSFLSNLLSRYPHATAVLREALPIPEPYAREVLIASIERTITTWLQTGAKESIDDMTHIILTLSHFDRW